MKLIIGLGNPGDKYERTRHNAGFWLLERFAAQTGTAMRKDAKFQALVGKHSPSGVWLLMPQTFMNASGRPVQMITSFFKIEPAEILVVHDELDFAPGVVKMKRGGGIAGHNGLRDISARLGSHDYWRLRIGVGHPGDRAAVVDYVLNKPSADDKALIDSAITRSLEVLPVIVGGDMQSAMLKLHTPDKAAEKGPANARPAPTQSGTADKPPKQEPPPNTEPAPQVDPTPADPPAPKEEPPAEPAPKAETAGSPGALKSLFNKLLPSTQK
jgi:PTH1 family peptidyl-tRNA hydrolase